MHNNGKCTLANTAKISLEFLHASRTLHIQILNAIDDELIRIGDIQERTIPPKSVRRQRRRELEIVKMGSKC